MEYQSKTSSCAVDMFNLLECVVFRNPESIMSNREAQAIGSLDPLAYDNSSVFPEVSSNIDSSLSKLNFPSPFYIK